MNRYLTIFALALSTTTFDPAAVGAASVYIPEGSAGEVAIVDSMSDAIVGRLEGLPDIHGLGGAPGASYLVAGSYAETAADAVAAVDKPAGVSVEEHAAHHAAEAGKALLSDSAVSILTIINAADGTVARRLQVPGAVHHVAVSPDGRFSVATHPNADGVSVVDLTAMAVRSLVQTGPAPNYAVFSRDGAKVYVSNSGNGTISVIDTKRWVVERNILAGDTPEHIILAPDGRTLYVANVDAGTVTELAVSEGKILRSFTVGGELHGLDIADDGARLFVSGKGENKLVAIDLSSGNVRSVPLGPAPYHLAVVLGSGKLYVSSRAEPKIWVVDQESLEVRSSIAIHGEGHQMLVLP